jgi:hypothetical protein
MSGNDQKIITLSFSFLFLLIVTTYLLRERQNYIMVMNVKELYKSQHIILKKLDSLNKNDSLIKESLK